LLDRPARVTVTSPVVAPAGTIAVMLPSDHAVVCAVGQEGEDGHQNRTVPDVPKCDPLITTDVSTGPHHGERPLITGPWSTVNVWLLLACPCVDTTTGPLVVGGTTAWMAVFDQLETEATIPFTVTEGPFGSAANPSPLIVMVCSMFALDGDRESMRERAVQSPTSTVEDQPAPQLAAYA
jgi:hypothetical protein